MTDDDAKCRHWFTCTRCQETCTPDTDDTDNMLMDMEMRIAILESRIELLDFEVRHRKVKE